MRRKTQAWVVVADFLQQLPTLFLFGKCRETLRFL
nr:MAG TPA: hypothetical protein [Caudoviricetes sp.]